MSYRSDWGAQRGPLRFRDVPGALGVIDDDGNRVGMATGGAWILDPAGGPPIARFRLRIGKQQLASLWTLVDRVFVPFPDDAVGPLG